MNALIVRVASHRTPLNQVMIYEQRSATLHSEHTFDRLHSQYTRPVILCSLTEYLVFPITPAASTTVRSPAATIWRCNLGPVGDQRGGGRREWSAPDVPAERLIATFQY
ncbi:unnamed protein product, partial [Brenthis ino]